MLQRSNYKQKAPRSLHTGFTGIAASLARDECGGRSIAMGQAPHTHDLRALLSAAAGLRRLAAEGRYEGDQFVYLLAAETMERRARSLAGQLPETDARRADPTLYRPVNLLV
jgi:hypothetical protein